MLRDFAPNVHIHKRYGKEVTVQYHPKAKAAACSLTRQMTIQQGTKADYKALSQFHYRTSRLPAPRKIFTLKRKEELCGVIVYSYPSPITFWQKPRFGKVTSSSFKAKSASSAAWLSTRSTAASVWVQNSSRKPLGQAGTPCVETVAVMAKYNPFFEKAGMQRIAESKPSTHVVHALQELERLGFDTALMASASYNEQKLLQTEAKPIVDALTELSLHDGSIRRRLASTKNIYPKHEEFTAKIEEFGIGELAVVLKRLSFCAQSKVYLFWKKLTPS